ncbi:uncharacterized protein [Epargyreus clarus]|uniref:uncharacterized protein n=1 Tax=Epargyreus clarus TaxID=520877 RepID=UPI003C2F4CD6
MLRNVELRKLPAGTLSSIVDILEINNDWKKVMSIIPQDPNNGQFEPKYNIEHINQIEEYARLTNQKCSEILFDEWGTSGRVRPTLAALRDVVVAAGVYRAGDEIANLLQEAPPSRPSGGPEQEITTSVTKIINQNMQQQISTAEAKDYSNKKEYQNRSTEPIQTAYYGVESVDTADLPVISALQPTPDKSTAQMESISDFMKFPTEQSLMDSYSLNSKIIHKDVNESNSNQQDFKNEPIPPQHPGGNLKQSSNIDLDSSIYQDTNLTHFRYCDLETITNTFSENLTNSPSIPGKVGSGGFGDVFICFHPNFGALAIKRANQDQLKHYKQEIISKIFNSEVKYLSKFRHKNIVPILGYSIDGPVPCIICEYVSGGSLLQKISERVLNENQRINIMIGAAEGLKYLHMSGMHIHGDTNNGLGTDSSSNSQNSVNKFMHGDVKSANILLTHNYEPKLCDFGLAKQYEATWEVSSPMGTSAYMAPEAFCGTVTQKNDIYSYGIVLLELLTGLKPIVDINGEKISIKIYVAENCKNDDITPLLDPTTRWTKAGSIFALTQMCLEYNRNDRPTMTSVCNYLYGIQNN